MYELILDESYRKKERKFFKRHPDLLERYRKILHILRIDPTHPSLRLHKLQGHLREYHSVSITLKYRIVLYFVIKDEQIILIDIGGHEIYQR